MSRDNSSLQRPPGKEGLQGILDAAAVIRSAVVVEARLRSLLESSFYAVCMLDGAEKVIYWNSQAEILYNLKKEDVHGKNVNDLFSNLILTRVLWEGRPVLGVYHQPRHGIYVLINAYPVFQDGKVIGSVSVERDITGMALLNRDLVKANNRALSLQRKIAEFSTGSDPFKNITGYSGQLREIVALARKVAQTDAAVLLCGESGTGKEVFARALHQGSPVLTSLLSPSTAAPSPTTSLRAKFSAMRAAPLPALKKGASSGRWLWPTGGSFSWMKYPSCTLICRLNCSGCCRKNPFSPWGDRATARWISG